MQNNTQMNGELAFLYALQEIFYRLDVETSNENQIERKSIEELPSDPRLKITAENATLIGVTFDSSDPKFLSLKQFNTIYKKELNDIIVEVTDFNKNHEANDLKQLNDLQAKLNLVIAESKQKLGSGDLKEKITTIEQNIQLFSNEETIGISGDKKLNKIDLYKKISEFITYGYIYNTEYHFSFAALNRNFSWLTAIFNSGKDASTEEQNATKVINNNTLLVSDVLNGCIMKINDAQKTNNLDATLDNLGDKETTESSPHTSKKNSDAVSPALDAVQLAPSDLNEEEKVSTNLDSQIVITQAIITPDTTPNTVKDKNINVSVAASNENPAQPKDVTPSPLISTDGKPEALSSEELKK